MPSPDADPKIVQRFSGKRGEKLVIECLKDQRIVLGNEEAAEELLARGQVVSFAEGDFLSAEDSWENDIFFILAGSVQITVKGFRVAQRSAGQHVGEMALGSGPIKLLARTASH